jgi:hypothetical protein
MKNNMPEYKLFAQCIGLLRIPNTIVSLRGLLQILILTKIMKQIGKNIERKQKS